MSDKLAGDETRDDPERDDEREDERDADGADEPQPWAKLSSGDKDEP